MICGKHTKADESRTLADTLNRQLREARSQLVTKAAIEERLNREKAELQHELERVRVQTAGPTGSLQALQLVLVTALGDVRGLHARLAGQQPQSAGSVPPADSIAAVAATADGLRQALDALGNQAMALVDAHNQLRSRAGEAQAAFTALERQRDSIGSTVSGLRVELESTKQSLLQSQLESNDARSKYNNAIRQIQDLREQVAKTIGEGEELVENEMNSICAWCC